MVLDTVHKITENNGSHGYELGDFKLVFKNTFADEENGQPKQVTMNAKDTDAPDFFYYVHVEVDLNAVRKCTCYGRCENKRKKYCNLVGPNLIKF